MVATPLARPRTRQSCRRTMGLVQPSARTCRGGPVRRWIRRALDHGNRNPCAHRTHRDVRRIASGDSDSGTFHSRERGGRRVFGPGIVRRELLRLVGSVRLGLSGVLEAARSRYWTDPGRSGIVPNLPLLDPPTQLSTLDALESRKTGARRCPMTAPRTRASSSNTPTLASAIGADP